MTWHNLNQTLTALRNPNLCDCSVMYEFQSDATTYFWIGVAVALAGCYMATAILKMVKHYHRRNNGD